MNRRYYYLPAIFALIIGFPPESIAEGKSYVSDTVKILDIEDPHREAQAWAICAASYDLLAEILQESSPARAKQLGDLANGAELAVIISIVMSELDADTTPEAFDSIWNFSKLSGGEIPKTMRTTLLADLESDTSSGKSKFLDDLGKTVAVCANNLDGQQKYIDLWRDLAKSGLLKFPSK